jgi:DNA-binding transcriptional LysR family regulator
MALACPTDHPFATRTAVPLEELGGARFVDFPQGWGTRLSVDRLFLESGLYREVAVEVADIPTVADLVRAGFGFAFLSPSLVPHPRRIALCPVRPEPTFAVSLITPQGRHPSAAVKAFIDLVLASYPAPDEHDSEV